MVDMGITIDGSEELQRKFRALGSRAVMQAAGAAVRKAGSIVSNHAKKIVRREAKVTGNLAKSIGVQMRPDYKRGVARAFIGPRSSYQVKGGVAKMLSKEARPVVYGIYIELGRYGKRVRRKGGVHYMKRALDNNTNRALDAMGVGVREKITQIAAKRGV